ncbi:MAG: leucine-rich repeat protein, partial [Clostridiales bacterium]|nr:leucine-rich repeat protein [Clostridiales bacterium]
MTRKNNRILAVILSLVMVLSSLPMLGVAQLTLFAPRAAAEGIDPLPGDVDGDGYLTTADARLIFRVSNGTEEPDSLVGSGDLNNDGGVGLADARYAFMIASLQETNDSLAPARTLEQAEYADAAITQAVSAGSDYDEDGLVSLSVKSEAFAGVTDGFFVVSYDPDALSPEYTGCPLDAGIKADVSGDGYVGYAFLYTEEAGGNEATLFEATLRAVGEPVDTELTVTFITLNGGDNVPGTVITTTEPLIFAPAVFAEPAGFVTFLGEQVVFSVGLSDYSDTQSGRIELVYPADLLEYAGYVPTLDGASADAHEEEGRLTIDFTCEAGDADEAQLCLAVFNPLRSGEVDYSVRLTGWNGEFNDDAFSSDETNCWISELWTEDNTEFGIGDVFTYTYSVDGFTGAISGDARLDIDPVMLEFVSCNNLLGSADHTEVNTDSWDHLDYSFDYSDGASGEDHAELFSVTLRALYPGECEMVISNTDWEGVGAPADVSVPVTVAAAGDFGGLHWSISPEDGVMTIEGEGEMPGTWRPDEDYYEIMPWDDLKDLITAVNVGEGVTSIADDAFFECGNLVSVSLPSTLESIGESAFARSGALQRVDLAALPASIGFGAFSDDEALSEFNYPEGDLASACLGGERYVDWGVENWDDEQRLREVFGGTPLFDAWYYDNFMQGDFDGFHWYMEENDDTYLAWNDEFNTPVGDGDEYDEGDVHLEEDFYTLYVSGEGPMPDFIYDDCRREGDEREERIQPWDRESYRVSRLVIGEGVTEIGDRSFCWFGNLRDVTLPRYTLTRIGEWAFELCQRSEWDAEGNEYIADSLREITIPASVTEIDRDAFRANKYLTGIDYDGLIDICLAGERYDDSRPDNECDRVEEVFGEVDSFYEWRDVYYYEHYMQGECGANGDNLTWALEDTDGFWVYDDTGEQVEDENDFGVPGTHWEPRYTLFISGEGDMKDFFCGNEEEGEESDPQPWDRERWKICRVIIGDGVTSVGDSAFRWCDNLRWVTLPDTLERIGEFAFEGCCSGEGEGEDWYPTDSLRAIDIPESVEYIGRDAFRNIPFLEEVECSRDLRDICVTDYDWDPVDRVRCVFDDDTEFYRVW